jgi:hypothetical protein
MTETLEESNAALRYAVETRLATGAYDEYITIPDPSTSGTTTTTSPLAGCPPAQACAADLLSRESCCEGQRFHGDSLLRSDVHPTSQAFFDLCDQLKTMHSKKSGDYGSADDPLANIRNGAEFVGIEPWRAAMVRLSDKVTRLATYCRTGSLTYENFEDTCFDLASYSLLTLLTHREAANGRPE